MPMCRRTEFTSVFKDIKSLDLLVPIRTAPNERAFSRLKAIWALLRPFWAKYGDIDLKIGHDNGIHKKTYTVVWVFFLA